MATGAGKSLIYQLPPVALRENGIKDAISIVISPLISLMSDQVNSLRAMGIPAGMLCSHTSHVEELEAKSGEYAVLYLSPEKLFHWQDSFVTLCTTHRIVCIAVDESHCVSE